ncbi:MAG: YlmH/Sll1252 family protein [Defluviitaleaceae bacterium]|nr:YlmH/Sll1252 family protein [Defluviitaleaceae bacterium]
MNIQNPFKDPDDKLLFARALDKHHLSLKRHAQTQTNFIDATRIAQFMPLLKGCNATAFGGYDEAERQIIIFNDEGIQTITPLAITYNEKFATPPTHRDYLGATLALGIDRAKIGDIRIGKNGAILYATSDMASFITDNLTQAGRVSVKVSHRTHKIEIEQTAIEKRITVPSMRLDAVLAAAFNTSRTKAAAFIDAGKVFVNHKETKKTHTTKQGDIITARGMGRVSINEICGTTKKDRIVLVVHLSK